MATLKSNFAVESKYETFYTGGKIQLSSDGQFMFCGCGNKVNVVEVATGKVKFSIGQEEDEEITSFCLTPNNQYIIVATQHLLLRQWEWTEQKLIRTWKAIHFAPVVYMNFDCTSTLLATGSADSTVKLWDIEKQYCTHNLRGHQGIISVVAFHPDISRLQLFSAGEDYKIRIWDLQTSKCIAETGAHYSLVTGICFSEDGNSVFTCGRDGVVCILDAVTFKLLKTVPVFEVVESMVLLPEGRDYPNIKADRKARHFLTAGNKGQLRVWNANTGKCVFTAESVHVKQQVKPPGDSTDSSVTGDDGLNIVQLVYNKTQDSVTAVTFDQNVSILDVETLQLQKQFAGNSDEILDLRYFGESSQYIVVTTNSRHIKVFELETWDCQILYGHTDIVLCIDVVQRTDMFITGGKDNTVRLWKLDPAQKEVSCLAMCQGHTNAVGALAVSRVKAKFFVSGSEDCTLKLWMLPSDLDPSVTTEIHAAITEKAHEKTISSVVVAPNDKFVATGSMDKTAKLWSAKDLSLIGVMRGHKRGIWCVQFSPIDQILATSSGDGCVKLWSLTDFSCVRTFEGHDCAVLTVTFVTRGMQLLSSGTNGLVKLWTIKTNECVKTLDEHEDKVWALAVGEADDTFITGGADSSLIVWKDVTETEVLEARQKQEQFILQEQELSNLIQQKKYLKAIGLAITLEQPFRLLNILKEIMSEETGNDRLCSTLAKLRMDQIDVLLRFCVQWNTNSRHCHEAQVVMETVLKMYPPTHLKQLGNLKSSVEGLIPYTERHFKRLSRLVQQSMFLEYTWHCMKGITSSSIEESGTQKSIDSNTKSIHAADDISEEGSSSESEVEMVEDNYTDAGNSNFKSKPSSQKASSNTFDEGDNVDNSEDDVEDSSSESEDEYTDKLSMVKQNKRKPDSVISKAAANKTVEEVENQVIDAVEGSESETSDDSSSESGFSTENKNTSKHHQVDDSNHGDSSDSSSEDSDNGTRNIGKRKDTGVENTFNQTLKSKTKLKKDKNVGKSNTDNSQMGKSSKTVAKMKEPTDKETESMKREARDSPPENICKNLFKEYLPKGHLHQAKGQNGKQTEGKAQKRKTPEDTVEFSIDRKASKVPSLCAEKPHFAAKIQTKGAKLKRLRKPRKL